MRELIVIWLRLFILVMVKIIVLRYLTTLLRLRSWFFLRILLIIIEVILNTEFLTQSCVDIIRVDLVKHPLKSKRHPAKGSKAITVRRVLLLSSSKLLTNLTIFDFLILQDVIKQVYLYVNLVSFAWFTEFAVNFIVVSILIDQYRQAVW